MVDAGDAGSDAGLWFKGCLEATTPAAVLPQESLEVEPRVLWRRELQGDVMHSRAQVAYAGERLAFLALPRTYLLDLDAGVISVLTDPTSRTQETPAFDSKGNLIYCSDEVRSVAPDGGVIWTRSLGPNVSRRFETVTTTQPVIGPDDAVYFVASDGYAYALHGASGEVKWKQPFPDGARSRLPDVSFGFGEHIVFQNYVFAAESGHYLGALDLESMQWQFVAEDVLVMHQAVVEQGDYVFRPHLLDACFNRLWSENPSPGWGSTIQLSGFDGSLLRRGSDGTNWIDRTGEPLQAPVQGPGTPIVIGTDGTLYTVGCTATDGGTEFSLQAFDHSLTMEWEVKWAGRTACGYPDRMAPALSEDGVMYFVFPISHDLLEVIAVQVTSPGPAPVAYPMAAYNNRRTNWVGQH